ncbi:AMP-binding protein [Nocardia sp. CA-129566]|uniref:AMP-binding protein n=1 Tax=Nocardia sp. CA-129566 TaxID=3239976 RepID=UPI003D95F628
MPSKEMLRALVEAAGMNGEDPALIFRGARTTYRQLLAMTYEFHGQLPTYSPDATEPLCVVATKSPETIALVLACVRAQRPVLLASPSLGGEISHTLCLRAGCTDVLSVGVLADGSPVIESRPVSGGVDGDESRRPIRPDVSLLLTTSGSTGTPKVVPLTGPAVDRFVDWAAKAFGIGRGTRVLSYAPLNFDLSLLDVWATLRFGGCVVLVDPDQATNSDHLLDSLAAPGIDLVQSVPFFYRLLGAAVRRGGQVLPGVRHVLFTGDSMPSSLLAAMAELFPAARLYNVYGCTETNDSLIHEIDRATLPLADGVPLGRPLPGVDVVIVGPDEMVVDGAGSGELLTSTPFQTRGYLDSELDKGRFVAHPDGRTPGVYYRTGDLVTRRPDGTIVLEGRNDFHVKVRGVRTNTQEVERVILAHPDVREAVVVGLPDELAGTRLHALVQREAGSALNSLHLRSHCARLLPRTAIPTSISITDLPIPKTSTGKPDRSRVRLQTIQ